MLMYNDIVWGEQGNTEQFENNSVTVATYVRRFPRGRWSFLGPGSEKKWYGTCSDKPDADWDKIAEHMMLNFAESSHQIVRATSALERGESRSKGKGKKSIHFNGSEENVELILRTVISANQLSIYGEVGDLCRDLSKDSRASGKLDANEHLETMEIPIELLVADPHTDAELQGNLLQDYERKVFITHDEEEGPNEMKNMCREYTLPRNEKASRARAWIIGNTNIGPVLNVKVCLHYKRDGIEIFRIVNGIDKDVTETSETIFLENVEHRVTKKLVAKAKPRPMPTMTLSPISIPVRERNWIDINPKRFRQDCFTVSKAMIRSLRHDQSVYRENDGAVRFVDIMEEFKKKFDGALQWSINDWISFLAKRGVPKKRFLYCLNPNSSEHYLYFRAIQGHAEGNLVDPELQDNVVTRGLHRVHLSRRKC